MKNDFAMDAVSIMRQFGCHGWIGFMITKMYLYVYSWADAIVAV